MKRFSYQSITFVVAAHHVPSIIIGIPGAEELGLDFSAINHKRCSFVELSGNCNNQKNKVPEIIFIDFINKFI
jgi:hypothetical protein